MKSITHTPRPSGPHSTGAIDVMVGRTKKGTLLRIFYPCQILDINTEIDHWTHWHLGENYSTGWGNIYFPCCSGLFSLLADNFFKNIIVPTIWEAPVQQGNFPVVVYSHGLASNRALASTTCTEIASHGYIVAVVEHRDGSANGSFVLNEQNEKVWIPHILAPESESQYNLRKNQVEIRWREVSRALDILELINGNGVKNDLVSEFDMSQFQGKMDLSKPIVSGHSFGGATALLVLAKDQRFVSGIMQDPWMFPIKDDILMLTKLITQPTLFILMETHQQKDNLEVMKPFEEIGSQFVTIRKAHHYHQTDILLVVPTTLHRILRAKSDANAETVMQLNNKIIMKFLWHNSGEKPDWLQETKRYLRKNEKHLIFKAHGTATSMLGWRTHPKSPRI